MRPSAGGTETGLGSAFAPEDCQSCGFDVNAAVRMYWPAQRRCRQAREAETMVPSFQTV